MIRIEHLHKSWHNGTQETIALQDINLQIKQGEIFGIIGRSGAGKSTLLRTLNLLERPSSGRIVIDNENVTDFDGKALIALRQKTGMIFQHFNLLNAKTVFDNLAWPLKASTLLRDAQARQKRVAELLALVGLDEHAHKYPAQLSGGQKQRVGIARALASRPRLLLCDEATSALDPETTQSILSLLADINHRFNLTIVLITHEMQVIRDLCDRVAVLDQGRIIEQAAVHEVFLHPREEITRSMVAQSDPLIATMLNPDQLQVSVNGVLVRLTYSGEITYQPILSRIAANSDIAISILQGEVSTIKNMPYGQLLLAIDGSPASIAQVFNMLDEFNVHHEIISIPKTHHK